MHNEARGILRMYTVYKITNIMNDKIYIGSTKRNINRRLQDHRNRHKREHQRPLVADLRQYGYSIFKVEPLGQYDDKNEAEYWEGCFIEHFCSYEPIGYNIRIGGTHAGKHAESTKEKLRKPKTQEHKNKLSMAAIGRMPNARQLECLEIGRHIDRKGRGIGEKNPNAKLMDYERDEIFVMYATGEYSQEELGLIYGVKQVTISKVIIRKRKEKQHVR